MMRLSMLLCCSLLACAAARGAGTDFLPRRFAFEPAGPGSDCRFVAHAGGGLLCFSETKVLFTARLDGGENGRGAGSAMAWVNPSGETRLVGEARLPGVSGEFFGPDPSRWRTGIPHFGALLYSQVYPGVDVRFYSTADGRLEYDLIVGRGAQPSVAGLEFSEAESIRLNDEGELVVEYGAQGSLTHRRPLAYQQVGDERREVEARYALEGERRVGFAVGAYDRELPLVIDPVVEFSAILGPGRPTAAAVDATGNIYVAGGTGDAMFPAADGQKQDGEAAFLVKLNPTGEQVLFANRFGALPGINDFPGGRATGVAVGPDERPVVVGMSGEGFPTRNALRTQPEGGRDAFVAKFSAEGELLFATYLGGESLDEAGDVAVDGAGEIYVVGWTASEDYPATTVFGSAEAPLGLALLIKSMDGGESWEAADDGITAVSVASVAADPNVPGLVYAGVDGGAFVSLDSGETWRRAGDNSIGPQIVAAPVEPGTAYAWTPIGALTFHRTRDQGVNWTDIPGFLDDLEPDSQQAGRLYGGINANLIVSDDGGENWRATGLSSSGPGVPPFTISHVEVHPADNRVLYAGGRRALFRSTDGAATWARVADPNLSGGINAICVAPSSTTTFYATERTLVDRFFRSTDGGKSSTDVGIGLPGAVTQCAVHPSDPQRVYAISNHRLYKSSNGGGDWRLVSGRLQATQVLSLEIDPFNPEVIYAGTGVGSGSEFSAAFVTKMAVDGAKIRYSSLLNGSGKDRAEAIAIDAMGRIVIAGTTTSEDWPVVRPLQRFRRGELRFNGSFESDAFVAQLSADGSELLFSTYWGGERSEAGLQVVLDRDGDAYLAGRTTSTVFPRLGGLPPPPSPPPLSFDINGFVSKFDLDRAELIYSTLLGGTAEDALSGLAIDDEGRAHVAGTTLSADFPVTEQAIRAPCDIGPTPNYRDGFVARFNAAGDRLERSLLFGGAGADEAFAIVLDRGLAYVAGATVSNNFVAGPKGFIGQRAGRDVFVTAFELETPRQVAAIRIDCVTNAADGFMNGIAAGEIVSFYGAGLGPQEGVGFELDAAGRLPLELGGTKVFFGPYAAPLLYTQDRQVNAITPAQVGPGNPSSMPIQILRNGRRTAPFYWGVAASAPGLFRNAATGYAAALTKDGVLDFGNPARAGGTITLFATGLGPTEPALSVGGVTRAVPPFALTTLPIRVTIDGVEAEILYAGAAPGLVEGVYQLNVRIPAVLGSRAYATVSVGENSGRPARIR